MAWPIALASLDPAGLLPQGSSHTSRSEVSYASLNCVGGCNGGAFGAMIRYRAVSPSIFSLRSSCSQEMDKSGVRWGASDTAQRLIATGPFLNRECLGQLRILASAARAAKAPKEPVSR
jgi:hypothetical protein